MILSFLLFVAGSTPTLGEATYVPSTIVFCTQSGWLHVWTAGSKDVRILRGLGTDLREPILSPDATRITYTWDDPRAQATQLLITDINGRERTTITKAKGFDRPLLWTSDGKSFVYSRDGVGTFVYDLKAKSSKKLTEVENVAPSPDGRWLAVLRFNSKLKPAYKKWDRGEFPPLDVWLYDKQLRPVRRLGTDSWYTDVEWLDNNRLRLAQVGPEPFDGDGYSLYHYIYGVSTGTRKRLPSGKHVHGMAISPNGRYIAESEEPGELYIRDLKSNTRRTIDKDTYSMQLMWSASGRWLYFQKMSSKPKHMYADTQQIWRMDTRSWKIEQLSDQPESYAYFHFDRDHRTVFFRNGDAKLSMSNDQYRVLPLCSANLLDSVSVHWIRLIGDWIPRNLPPPANR